MEMTKEQWLSNAACAEAGVNAENYTNGQCSDEEMLWVEEKLDQLRNAPLYISDKNQTIESLCTFIRDMATDKKCQIVAFDHFGRILKRKGKGTMNDEVTEQSNMIISVAKDCRETAVIGISQMNRTPPGVKFIEPDINRLKDSGALGADAALLLFLYPAVDPDSLPPESDIEMIAKVEKNRFGKRGKYGLLFKKTNQKFVE
jgi:replicative DNA helicase